MAESSEVAGRTISQWQALCYFCIIFSGTLTNLTLFQSEIPNISALHSEMSKFVKARVIKDKSDITKVPFQCMENRNQHTSKANHTTMSVTYKRGCAWQPFSNLSYTTLGIKIERVTCS